MNEVKGCANAQTLSKQRRGVRNLEDKKRLMDADEFLGKLQKLAELLKQGKISEIDINLLIASTPIVDAVEVVHAKWHDVYLLSPWVATGVCGHCKITSYINPDFPYAKYCPNCGARMDEGRN